MSVCIHSVRALGHDGKVVFQVIANPPLCDLKVPGDWYTPDKEKTKQKHKNENSGFFYLEKESNKRKVIEFFNV